MISTQLRYVSRLKVWDAVSLDPDHIWSPARPSPKIQMEKAAARRRQWPLPGLTEQNEGSGMKKVPQTFMVLQKF